MPFETLTAISSVDGRYHGVSTELSEYFSEYALIKKRIVVECEYLIALSDPVKGDKSPHEAPLRPLSEEEKKEKKIKKENNHDVKAVEYYIKRRLQETSMNDIAEWVHFGLTSEDINSVAYGLLLRDALQKVFLLEFEKIQSTLNALTAEHTATPMLARTHGQPASPTT